MAIGWLLGSKECSCFDVLQRIVFVGFMVSFCSYYSIGQNLAFRAENFPGREGAFQQAKNAYSNGDIFFENGKTYCKYMLEDGVYCKAAAGFFDEALIEYKSAFAFNPDYAMLNFKMALCYFVSNKTDSALVHFENAYRLNNTIDKHIVYFLASCFHKTGQWQKAVDYYQRYLSTENIEKKTAPVEAEQIPQQIRQCQFAMTLNDSVKQYVVSNLGAAVNSPFSEYGPVVSSTGNSLLLTARKPDFRLKPDDMDSITFETDEENYIENIYITYLKHNTWVAKKRMGDMLTVVGEHNAVLDLSSDSEQLLVYKSKKGGDIYVGMFENGNWAGDEPLQGNINSSHAEPSACLSADKQTMYFTSTRNGGFGGRDIYSSVLDSSGLWSQPMNLGPVINTEDDEVGVLISEDGKRLYFSSKGHQGIGGYDLFVSQLTDTGWALPVNLGVPINSPYDDIYYSQTEDGSHSYFASDRHGGFGRLDIYSVTSVQTKQDAFVLARSADSIEIISDRGDAVIILNLADENGGVPKHCMVRVEDENNVCIHRQQVPSNGRLLLKTISGTECRIYAEASGYASSSTKFTAYAGSDSVFLSMVLHPLPNLIFESESQPEKEVLAVIQEMVTGKPVNADQYVVDAHSGDTVAVFQRSSKYRFVPEQGREYKIITVAEGYITQVDNISVSQSGFAVVPVALYQQDENSTQKAMDADSLAHQILFCGSVTQLHDDRNVESTIIVYDQETGRELCRTRSKKDGLFSFMLPTETYYKIEVQAQGYLTQTGYINAAETDNVIEVTAQLLRTEDAVLKNNVNELLIRQRRQKLSVLDGSVYRAGTQIPISAQLIFVDSATGKVCAHYNADDDGYFAVVLPSEFSGTIQCSSVGYTAVQAPVALPQGKHKTTSINLYPQAEAKMAIRFPNINFETAQQEYGKAYTNQLQKIVDMLQLQKTVFITITGHTDSKGSTQYNQQLSLRRAKKVADYFIAHGIDADRLQVAGNGEEQPIADNTTESGRSKNRRVEVGGVIQSVNYNP